VGIIVYNADGTAGRKCQCTYLGSKTWLGHWAQHSGYGLPGGCQAKRCKNGVEVGAHVKTEDDMRTIWIIPFCQKHNKRPSSQPIELKGEVPLVGGSMTADCA
jgi:hypothetical protein